LTGHVNITVLTQPECNYCEIAKQVLTRLCAEYPLQITEVDLRSVEGQALAISAGVLFAPGVLVDGEPFSYGRLSERKLRRTLNRHAVS